MATAAGRASQTGRRKKRLERVNHPAHYGGADNPYETIKVLEAWLTPEELEGFCKGNAIKYLSRAGKHPDEVKLQSLKKSRWYQDYMIQSLERRKAK